MAEAAMTHTETQEAIAAGRWHIDPPCPTCGVSRLVTAMNRDWHEEPVLVALWPGGPLIDTGKRETVWHDPVFTLTCGHTITGTYTLTVWREGCGPAGPTP